VTRKTYAARVGTAVGFCATVRHDVRPKKKPPQGQLSQVGLGKPKFGKVERSEVDASTGIEQVEAFQWYRRPFERAVDQIKSGRVEVLIDAVYMHS